MSQSGAEAFREKLCGMKYMHKARRDQQAGKLTTPELWHRCHLDTYPSVPLPSRVAERTTQEAEAEGVFYAGELWAVEFNLGFTSDIVPPWLSSYWGQVYGVRQWGLFLVISRPASQPCTKYYSPQHYVSEFTDPHPGPPNPPSISADPFINQQSTPRRPTFTHTFRRSSLMKTCYVSARHMKIEKKKKKLGRRG